jgi:hypothetical protein
MMKSPRSSAIVLAAVLFSVGLGGAAWARPVERPPASSEGAHPVASSTPPPATGVPTPAPRPAAAAPAQAPSRGGGHVARQASVSVVFVLLAIVTLFLV